jgi:hypothetical protein
MSVTVQTRVIQRDESTGATSKGSYHSPAHTKMTRHNVVDQPTTGTYVYFFFISLQDKYIHLATNAKFSLQPAWQTKNHRAQEQEQEEFS